MRNLFICLLSLAFLAGCAAGCASKKQEPVKAASSGQTVDKSQQDTTAAAKAAEPVKKEESSAKTAQLQPGANEPMTEEVVAVEDASIATNIESLNPVGVGTEFTKETPKLYCWSKISSQTGDTSIKHIWYHNDKMISEIPLNIKAKTWRTFSFKTILPEWAGDWKVDITDKDGKLLKSLTFTVK